MSEVDNGGPAYPAFVNPVTDIGLNDITSGMSLRDYFAAQALTQGMSILVANQQNLNEYQLGQLAKTAYSAADAMLKARQS